MCDRAEIYSTSMTIKRFKKYNLKGFSDVYFIFIKSLGRGGGISRHPALDGNVKKMVKKRNNNWNPYSQIIPYSPSIKDLYGKVVIGNFRKITAKHIQNIQKKDIYFH